LNITIHNLYSGLELAYPVYCSNGTTHRIFPNQQTDVGTTMKASFGIDSREEYFKCVLLYKLQKKHATKTDSQPDNSITSTKNIATTIYLLIIWDVKDRYHRFCVCLMECTDDFTWDEDKLWTLHREYGYQFPVDYKSNRKTWLIHDGTTVKTRFDVTYGLDYKLDIVLSEGTGKYNMKRPIQMDLRRLVLTFSMLIFANVRC
jgi:hypothetical protein